MVRGLKVMEASNSTGTLSEEDAHALRERIRDLEAALGQNDAGIANTFRLTPTMTNLLGLLLALPTVNAEIIGQRLGIDSDAKVAIHRLRQELKPWDVAIQSKRMLGYWLDPGTKQRVKAMLSNPGLLVMEDEKAPDPATGLQPAAETA